MKDDQLLEQFWREVVPRIVRLYSPAKVLIFGSRAKGNATCDSDIDVIIVAEAFTEIPSVRRMSLVMKSARFKKHVDYLCYTPREFERLKDTSSILRDALPQSIELALWDLLQGFGHKRSVPQLCHKRPPHLVITCATPSLLLYSSSIIVSRGTLKWSKNVINYEKSGLDNVNGWFLYIAIS